MSSRTWVHPSLGLEPPAPRSHAVAPQVTGPQAGRIVLLLSLGMWAAIWKLGTLIF